MKRLSRMREEREERVGTEEGAMVQDEEDNL